MKNLIFILLLAGICALTDAQVQDFQIWTGPVLKYNFSKKFRAEFEQQFRFNDNASKYDYTFSELGLRYKVFKYLELKAVFRQSFLPPAESGSGISDSDKSRLCFAAGTGTELFNTGVNLGYRLMYQDSWENSSLKTSQYIRNRINVDYNLSKLVDPYIDWESYFRLDGKNEFRQNRYTVGLNWRILKQLNLDTYYRYQKEINVKNPEADFILGLGLIYSIN
jgi:hypothetical protein